MINKKIYILTLSVAAALMVTACQKNSQETTQTAEKKVENRQVEITETSSGADSVVMETQDEVSMEEEIKAFAGKIQEAVAVKDMVALEKLLSYPTYIGDDTSAGLVINSTDEFLALKPEQVFAEGLVGVIATVDTSALEMTETGVVMGEGILNITFNILEGSSFGITGINE